MKAALYMGKQDIKMLELPNPICGDNDVLLKNVYASICGTDVFMTVNAKSVEMNMTSAIAVAAYTTYKIISSSVNFKKSKRSDDMLVREVHQLYRGFNICFNVTKYFTCGKRSK